MSFFKSHSLWLVGALLALASFLRLYHWQTYPFGFDQVQIVEAAERITQGDLVLIGPRTGPAAMFTGPLIYYIAAAWWLFLPVEGVVIATSLTISLITGAMLYWLAARYQGRTVAQASLALWAVSPLMVGLDRITWNPNLTFLAASLVLFPVLHQISGKKLGWLEYGLLAAGSFLGYQAHFSGFLLPLLAAVTLLLGFTPTRTWFVTYCLSGLALASGLLSSLLPTIVFDYRHDWLNLRGFLTLIHGTEGAYLIDRIKYFGQAIFAVLIANGKLLAVFDTPLMSGVVGLMLLSLVLWKLKKSGDHEALRQSVALTMWTASTALVLSLYRGEKPEYYYLVTFPALILLLSLFVKQLRFSFKQQVLIISVFATISTTFVMTTYHKATGVSLGNTLKVVAELNSTQKKGELAEITYDMDTVHAIGLKYFLDQLTLTDVGKNAHLQYPYYLGTLTSISFQDLGVWYDPRVSTQSAYLTRATYYLEYSPQLSVYLDVNYHGQGQLDTYQIFGAESMPLGSLLVFDRSDDVAGFERLSKEYQAQTNNSQQSWNSVVIDTKPALAYWKGQYLLVFYPTEITAETPASYEWLNSLTIHD